MDYSQALEMVKAGYKLRSAGWNGKNQFIFLVPGSCFEVSRAPLLGIFPAGTVITYLPHIDIYTEQGTVCPWLASQSDQMADDWEVVTQLPVAS